jgi:hypothetical protein
MLPERDVSIVCWEQKAIIPARYAIVPSTPHYMHDIPFMSTLHNSPTKDLFVDLVKEHPYPSKPRTFCVTPSSQSFGDSETMIRGSEILIRAPAEPCSRLYHSWRRKRIKGDDINPFLSREVEYIDPISRFEVEPSNRI